MYIHIVKLPIWGHIQWLDRPRPIGFVLLEIPHNSKGIKMPNICQFQTNAFNSNSHVFFCGHFLKHQQVVPSHTPLPSCFFNHFYSPKFFPRIGRRNNL